jgi:hypothetical protein
VVAAVVLAGIAQAQLKALLLVLLTRLQLALVVTAA